MDSEKVKEIKKIAMACAEKNKPYCRNCSKGKENDIMLTCRSLLKDMLALVNELESENERLLNEKWDKEDDLDNYHEENQELKDQIAELKMENATKTGTIAGLLKHFVERLKEKATWSFIMCGDHNAGAKTVTLHDIDETLKEFIDGKV